MTWRLCLTTNGCLERAGTGGCLNASILLLEAACARPAKRCCCLWPLEPGLGDVGLLDRKACTRTIFCAVHEHKTCEPAVEILHGLKIGRRRLCASY